MGKGVTSYVAIDGTPFFRKMDGVGRYGVDFVTSLANQSPATRFIVVGFRDDRHKTSLLPSLKNVEYRYLPIPRKLYQFLFSRYIALPLDWVLPKIHLQLCLNFTTFPYLRRPKKLTIIHDTAYLDLPETIERKNLKYLNKRVPWSVKKSDAIICPSHFTESRIQALLGAKKTYVIPPAVSQRFYTRYSPQEILAARKQYNLPENYILTVSTIEPRKNLKALIQAHRQLPSSLQHAFPLVVVGASGWGKELSEKTPGDTIHICGYVDDADLPKIYQGASYFVFPSKYEGFGLPLAEAIASNIPAISSDIASVREFVGTTIPLSKPDTASITQTLETFLRAKTHPTTKASQALSSYYTAHSLDTLRDTYGL